MDESEFKSRKLAVREGESIDNKRDLQGQSPYLINIGINYDHRRKLGKLVYFITHKVKLLRL